MFENTTRAQQEMTRNPHLVHEEEFRKSIIRMYNLHDFQYDEMAEIVDSTWAENKEAEVA